MLCRLGWPSIHGPYLLLGLCESLHPTKALLSGAWNPLDEMRSPRSTEEADYLKYRLHAENIGTPNMARTGVMESTGS